MLYAHEFYWDRRRARASTLGGSKCHVCHRGARTLNYHVAESPTRPATHTCGPYRGQLWRRDEDWPTVEPLLSRTDTPTPEGLLALLRLLPNKTVWFHGDSITTQV